MDLPSKERTFEIEYIGLDTGKEYKGRFTVLCLLNVGQKHARDLEQTRLLGGYENPTDPLIGLSIVLSNLRAKIVDAPEWWKQSQGGSLIEDEDVLMHIYNKVRDAESSWKEDLKKKTQAIPDQISP